MSDHHIQLLGRTVIMLLFAGVVIFLMWSCETVNNYNDPHAGCTEVWVLEGFRWDEKQEAWVVKPGKRPKKLVWMRTWECD